MSWSTQSGWDATSVFLFCFHLLNPFVVRLFWIFLFFWSWPQNSTKQFLFQAYIYIYMFLNLSANLENGICSLNTSGGPEKTFRRKKKHRRKRKTFEQNSLQGSLQTTPKNSHRSFVASFFVDQKKKTCFFESSRVVVWFFVVLFCWFWWVFDSTKFPHRVKKQPPENLGGRCQVCFLWRAPIANTNTWTELPGGFQKNPRFSAAAA